MSNFLHFKNSESLYFCLNDIHCIGLAMKSVMGESWGTLYEMHPAKFTKAFIHGAIVEVFLEDLPLFVSWKYKSPDYAGLLEGSIDIPGLIFKWESNIREHLFRYEIGPCGPEYVLSTVGRVGHRIIYHGH